MGERASYRQAKKDRLPPSKGFIPLTFVKGVASYLIFTSVTTLILRISLGRPRVALVVALIAGAAAGGLSLYRTRQAPRAPLIFDDELPRELNPLRLNPD
jgi:small-conductance mechanosensitive channel